MKKFDELSPQLQEKAVMAALNDLLKAIVDGAITFNDKANSNDLQARIEKACKQAMLMHTPWYAHEYILDTCQDDLMGIARGSAKRALYREPGELVLDLPA